MKEILKKVKNFFTNSWIGIIIYSAIILLWSLGAFKNTNIGYILDAIGIIVGICIFCLLGFCFIATIYVLIKNSLKETIREEILTEEKRKEQQK